MEKITIFTPTYNRAYTLQKLYASLCAQTSGDFVWLIVDDGSEDETKEIIDLWIKENIIKIRYYFQENSGKSMAHNKGVELTETELFTCVDSDDSLCADAVASILEVWENSNKQYTGVLCLKKNVCAEGNEIYKVADGVKSCTLRKAYSQYGLRGDAMLVYKTEIIGKYRFPRFPEEKFVPEAYLYDRIDRDGELLVLNKELYLYEYLSDGYTANMASLLKRNPQGYLAYIIQRLEMDRSFTDRAKDSIRYLAMAKVAGNKRMIKNAVYPLIAFLVYPLGILFYHIRYR